MNQPPSYLKNLRDDVEDELDAPQAEERRARISAELQAKAERLRLGERAGSRRPSRSLSRPVGWGTGLFAAAAAAAVLAGIVSGGPSGLSDNAELSRAAPPGRVHPEGVVGHRGKAAAPPQEREIEPAEMTLASGAHVLARGGTKFGLAPLQTVGVEELRLATGRVELTVPKLKEQQRLLVTTQEAVVEVRGTAFSVGRSEESGAWATEVSVSEGVVSVKSRGREVLLEKGESWSSRAGAVPAEDVTEEPGWPSSQRAGQQPTKVSAAPSAKPPEKSVATEALEAPAVESDLALQNALYEKALAARNAGDAERARALLQELLSSYPKTPLRVGAQKELRKLAEEDSK